MVCIVNSKNIGLGEFVMLLLFMGVDFEFDMLFFVGCEFGGLYNDVIVVSVFVIVKYVKKKYFEFFDIEYWDDVVKCKQVYKMMIVVINYFCVKCVNVFWCVVNLGYLESDWFYWCFDVLVIGLLGQGIMVDVYWSWLWLVMLQIVVMEYGGQMGKVMVDLVLLVVL